MWVRELAWIDPIEAAPKLAALGAPALLDSALPHPSLGRFSYLAADPFGLFQVCDGAAFWNGRSESGPPLDALRARLASCRQARHPDLPPFQGGAIGFFSYDFGWSLEGRRPPITATGDEVHLGFYDVIVAFDHVARRCWLMASGLPAATSDARRQHARIRLDLFEEHLSTPSRMRDALVPNLAWHAEIVRADHLANVERVKDYIRAGDIYQANIAQRFVAALPPQTDPWPLYCALRRSNPAPFSAYLECGARTIVSTSPESFLRCDGHKVETRPIKGTARRSEDAVLDREAAAALLASRKDRAENVMIVDLLRNDLSKVCVPASVEVTSLCELESYAGLHHLVSAVTGELEPGRDALDLFAAAFPGGSITGAPKIRAMEIIAEIEGKPRGVYCGAIGSLGFDGSLDLSIAIRTIVIEAGQMDLRAGGGITILSDPDAEYEETLTKARRLFDAFETTRALVEFDA